MSSIMLLFFRTRYEGELHYRMFPLTCKHRSGLSRGRISTRNRARTLKEGLIAQQILMTKCACAEDRAFWNALEARMRCLSVECSSCAGREGWGRGWRFHSARLEVNKCHGVCYCEVVTYIEMQIRTQWWYSFLIKKSFFYHSNRRF